ncbi:MAG: rubrerythrin family protein [Chlorobium sp.]|nr:MAG: rubrerythrin family protein [Chlorobium sp.]
MTATLQKHLDESIKLELNLARLYTMFNDCFADDEDFWWDMAMEEQGHATLLQQEKLHPQQKEFFPENLLASDLQSLIDTNTKIAELIAAFKATPLSRAEAFQTAYALEMAAGESHFQQFLDSPSNSFSSNIFKQLNQEDRDHAARILEYMQVNHIKKT